MAEGRIAGKKSSKGVHGGPPEYLLWVKAEKLKGEIEHAKQTTEIGIRDALDAFLKECESRNLNRSTLSKYKRLATTLNAYADPRGLASLLQLDGEHLREFRGGWKLAPRTSAKALERLRAFFRFCQGNCWLSANPAKAIRAPQVKVAPRIPFSGEEIGKILSKARDDHELADHFQRVPWRAFWLYTILYGKTAEPENPEYAARFRFNNLRYINARRRSDSDPRQCSG